MVVRTIDTPPIGSEQLIANLASPKQVVDIREFLQKGKVASYGQGCKLPSNAEGARKVRNRVAWFTLLDGVLYMRDFEGATGGRSLASKVTRARYYSPHSLKDAEDFARKCPKCQEHRPVLHDP